MAIYKYTSFEIGFQTIENLKIRVTQPSALNDPYDCLPIYKVDLNEKLIHLLYELIINDKNLFQKLLQETREIMLNQKDVPKEQLELLTFDFFVENFPHIKELIYRSPNIQKIKKMIVETLFEKINKEIGLISLTKNPTSMLMWSHYADAHRGLVIEFDETDPLIRKSKPSKWDGIEKIKYVRKRPIVKVHFENPTEEEMSKFGKSLFFKKNRDWEYEKECRVLKPLRITEKTGKFDKEGYEICLISFASKAIKSIILGARTNDQNVLILLYLLKSKNLNHVKVKQANISKTTYSLRLKRLTTNKAFVVDCEK